MLGKYSHLGILGGVVISVAVTPLVVAQILTPKLYVSYPPADYQTASDRIFLIGSAPSEGKVSVNKKPVPRSQRGHFASVFNLKVGKNTFEIDYKGQSKTIVVTRSAAANIKSPNYLKLIIDGEFIGAVIGPGGKIIQEIQKSTGATINITEVGKTGEVSIFSADKESLDQAVAWVKSIVAVPEVGDVFDATVKSIKEFGAFVEFLPGKQGLLHISEIMWKRLETMEGVLNEGDKVKVKIIGVDPKTGKFKLSRKALLPKPEQTQAPRPAPNQGN